MAEDTPFDPSGTSSTPVLANGSVDPEHAAVVEDLRPPLSAQDGTEYFRTAYLRLRPVAATPEGCVELMRQEWDRQGRVFDPLGRVDGTLPEWEAAYQLQQAQELLSRPELDPTVQLREVLETRGELGHQRAEIATQISQSGIEGAGDLYDRWNALTKQLDQLDRKAATLRDSVQRNVLERTTPPRDLTHWSAREDAIFEALARQYTGYGQVYELLCRQVAEVRVKMEMAQASGREVPIEEFQKLHRLNVDVIAQLQKYTETLKSVALGEEVQTAVRRILAIVEQEVAAENPHLWRRVVTAIRQRVEGT
jgi:hypothetical protein